MIKKIIFFYLFFSLFGIAFAIEKDSINKECFSCHTKQNINLPIEKCNICHYLYKYSKGPSKFKKFSSGQFHKYHYEQKQIRHLQQIQKQQMGRIIKQLQLMKQKFTRNPGTLQNFINRGIIKKRDEPKPN